MKIRKKVFELDAVLLTERSIHHAQSFIEGRNIDLGNSITADKFWDYENIVIKQGGIFIKTLESNGETQLASFGDYIIKRIKGEFYPCKPDIFKELYEILY